MLDQSLKGGFAQPAQDSAHAFRAAMTVMARPGAVTIVAIGPLTNVAQAIRAEPRFAANVRQLVIMGGAIYLVHWGQWSNIPSETHPFGGMEFQTLLVAAGLFFVLRGNKA